MLVQAERKLADIAAEMATVQERRQKARELYDDLANQAQSINEQLEKANVSFHTITFTNRRVSTSFHKNGGSFVLLDWLVMTSIFGFTVCVYVLFIYSFSNRHFQLISKIHAPHRHENRYNCINM